MGRNPSVTPPGLEISSPRDRYHKKLLFVSNAVILLFFLAGVGILYFKNYSAPVVQQVDNGVIHMARGDYKWVSLSQVTYGNDFYVKDDAIYWFANLLKISDPFTALALQNASTTEVLVVKDKNYVYEGVNAMTGEPVTYSAADPATFEPVSYSNGYGEFYKDKNNVYLASSSPLPGADPQTFAFMGVTTGNVIYLVAGTYFKDKNQIYFQNDRSGEVSVVPGADLTTFELSSPFNGTYGATASTTSCGPGCYYDAQDKNHTYLMGQVVGTTTDQIIENTVSVSNYQAETDKNGNSFGTIDILASIEPFSHKKLEFTASAQEVFDPQYPHVLSDYSFHFESKGNYGILYDSYKGGQGSEVLWIMPVGTSSVSDAIYSLIVYRNAYYEEETNLSEFKENCSLKYDEGKSEYYFDGPTDEQVKVLIAKYGDTPDISAFYCQTGRYYVFGNVIVANYSIPMDATELKADDKSIQLVDAATTAQ